MTQSFYLVVGLGKTGRSIAGYLQRRKLPFMVFDTRSKVDGVDAFASEFPGIEIFLGELPEGVYPCLKEIIASPGVAIDAPFLLEAARRHIPIIGDIECLARAVTAPVIAITGTNGKSTVTTLVGEMAKAAGFKVAVAGNIGTPVLDLLDDGQPYDLWVLELSSFQLDLIDSLAPVAAALLNITADHLDRHHSLDAYISAKQRIYHRAGVLVYNRDDKKTFPNTLILDDSCRLSSYGLDGLSHNEWDLLEKEGQMQLVKGDAFLMPVEQLRLKGRHNWQNCLAACALAEAINIAPQHMMDVLKNFPGLPHRCEWVRTLDDVEWINDSKGTNIGATISAISGIGGSMQGKIVLIAGGLGKGADFNELRFPVSEYARSVILIGTDADKIEQGLGAVVPVLHASSLVDAVFLARAQAIKGDVVLLSPACASQDMFRDFNHRGDAFVESVNAL